MNIISDLEWRYATKQFDATKKVSNQDLETLKKAVQLSASSFGLQLYKVLVVENKEIRESLVEHSWGQKQVVDASHLFVFCNYKDATEANVDQYVDLIAETRSSTKESLKGYHDAMNGFVANLSTEAKVAWMQKQVYIAMGNLLTAAASLKIDACPMEGFLPEKYNEILGLNEKGLNACVLVPVGYRHAEDGYQHAAKVRKPMDEMFITVD